MNSKLSTQIAFIGLRAIRRTLRQPVSIVFPVVFPLAVLAVNVGGLAETPRLMGFPTDKVINFVLAFTFIQGTLSVSLNSSTDIARDIETGFMDRLSLTPIRPMALLFGQLAGALMMAMVTAITYILVALVAGATIKSGILGIPVLIALTIIIAFAFSSLGALIATRAGSGEVVQGLFPLMFVTLFFSTAILPLDLIETDWFRFVATINPVSYMIDGIRSLFITGWDVSKLLVALGVALGIATVSLIGAGMGLKKRMART